MKFKEPAFFSLIIFLNLVFYSGATDLKTPAEEIRYTGYSQNEDIARFLSRLQSQSGVLKVRLIGRSQEVENYPAKDLYLCLLTGEGVAEPQALNRHKPTVFYFASQHGNEQSAKEAALRLIRDLASGDLKPLLEKINVLVMPQSNPYGNFYNVRENEIGLDLNRDHVKLEGQSTQAIHRVFNLYQPEVTMDVHEKGDDYYRVSIGCVSNLNIHPSLQAYSRQVILAGIEQKLEKRKITFHEYLVSDYLGLDTSSGAAISPQEEREILWRYSTTDLNDGRNSLGIYETLSFIQEGASRHDLETLEARTNWQYQGIRALAEIVADRPGEIIDLVRGLRANLQKRAELRAADDPVKLKMDYVRDEREPQLVVKSFEPSASPIRGILKVDKKAGDYLTAGDLAPYRGPSGMKVITRVEKNWFPRVESKLAVSRPLGYIVPAGRQDVVDVLLAHGIKVQMIEKEAPVKVAAYQIDNLVPAKADYLAPEKMEVRKEELVLLAKKGDFFVSCSQPAANLIPGLLEPQSDYGLIRYFKFKLVPETGNYFDLYRLETPVSLEFVDYKLWK
jgi:hypothetical protein